MLLLVGTDPIKLGGVTECTSIAPNASPPPENWGPRLTSSALSVMDRFTDGGIRLDPVSDMIPAAPVRRTTFLRTTTPWSPPSHTPRPPYVSSTTLSSIV